MRAPYNRVRPEWLARRHETVVDPSRKIIDAHHHIWRLNDERYFVEDFRKDIQESGHRVVASVCVQGGDAFYRHEGPAEMASLGETETIRAQVAEDGCRHRYGPKIAIGYIAQIDLTLGERAGSIIDAHDVVSQGCLRGVRQISAWHADPQARGSTTVAPPGLLYDRSLRRGLMELQDRSLIFEAWMYHTQLRDLIDLAHAMPDLMIVLNHLGGPLFIGPYVDRTAEVYRDWKYDMGRLSECPNLRVKLGGRGMALANTGLEQGEFPPSSDELATSWGPYFRGAIELFGPDRCILESNFPVDKGLTSYNVLWNSFKKIISVCSEEDQNRLLYGNANRIYRLGLRDE